MIRPLIFGIAILIAGVTQVTAQGVPSFKVEQGCRDVSRGPDKLTTFDKCMQNEKNARDELINNWETFVASDRRVCLDGDHAPMALRATLNFLNVFTWPGIPGNKWGAAGRINAYFDALLSGR